MGEIVKYRAKKINLHHQNITINKILQRTMALEFPEKNLAVEFTSNSSIDLHFFRDELSQPKSTCKHAVCISIMRDTKHTSKPNAVSTL